MHPVVGQIGSIACLGLRNFVAVMNWNMVFATAVNIEQGPKVFGSHSRTLDMPAGEAFAPRAFPFHLSLFVRWAELPQCKVGNVAFFALLYTSTGLQAFTIEPGQIAVLRILAGVKVDAVFGGIGQAFCFNLLYCFELLGNVIGGFAQYRRHFNIE